MSLFVTFEGTAGSGKTTQLQLLAEYLKNQGYDVLVTREPGGTAIGDRVRDILLDPEYTDMEPMTEVLLFSASRAQLVNQMIRPHLARDGLVLCDRYADSTLAYQGYGHGMDLSLLWQITALATGGLVPDLTFYLDLPAERGLRRRADPAVGSRAPDADARRESPGWPLLWEGHDRLDMQLLEFHQRVRHGYLQLAAAEPQRSVVVDADRPVDDIQRDVRCHLRRWLDTGQRRNGRD